jgi:hypothetical protein
VKITLRHPVPQEAKIEPGDIIAIHITSFSPLYLVVRDQSHFHWGLVNLKTHECTLEFGNLLHLTGWLKRNHGAYKIISKDLLELIVTTSEREA